VTRPSVVDLTPPGSQVLEGIYPCTSEPELYGNGWEPLFGGQPELYGSGWDLLFGSQPKLHGNGWDPVLTGDLVPAAGGM